MLSDKNQIADKSKFVLNCMGTKISTAAKEKVILTKFIERKEFGLI